MAKAKKKSIIKKQAQKIRPAAKKRPVLKRAAAISSKKNKANRVKQPRKKEYKKIFIEKFPEMFSAQSQTNGGPAQAHTPPQHAEYHGRSPQWMQPRELPANYGDNQIYLMVRDPYWLYSYWEIQKDHQERAFQSLGGDWNYVTSILRVYDVTDSESHPHFFDITLRDMVDHWFINVNSNRTYFVDIGLLHRSGRFVVLARSNRVTTPRSGMSDVLDEEWMSIDFDRLYALSGGLQMGKSSMELTRLMQERLMKAVSSGSGAFSPVRLAEKRGFRFWLDCELIVFGGTEPDAKVTFQGKEVKLRPDGTFSFRFALPDGKKVLDAVAESADGIEVRKIIPTVERNTERPEPVIRKKMSLRAMKEI